MNSYGYEKNVHPILKINLLQKPKMDVNTIKKNYF
jgi:hypothetical protein